VTRSQRIALLALALTAPGYAAAAPISFNSALPVAEDEFIWRQQLHWLHADDAGRGADRSMRATAAISVLGYGVNHKLALFAALPYTDKALTMAGPDARIRRDNRGVGDATAFARYTFWQRDAPARTLRLAGFGGVTVPTGEDDAQDRFGRLPSRLQDGSGAWNRLGGLVATYQTLDFELDGQLSYRDNRAANAFEAGDETGLDLSSQVRLWPRQLAGGVPGFLYGVLELNLLHQGKDRRAGLRDDDSGGNSAWISPGVQYVTRRWVLEALAQIPVSQRLHGTALRSDPTVTVGVRFVF